MKYNKYVFRKYNSKSIKFFQKEEKKLKRILPKNCKIEHVGSTSIEYLGGKGIMDILIGVPGKNQSKIKNILEENNYKSQKVRGRKDKCSFERDYGFFIKRRIHVHLTFLDSMTWKEYTLIRDYLRKNPDMAKKYQDLKKEAIKFAKGDGKKYQDYKRSFLNKIKRKVLKTKK